MSSSDTNSTQQRAYRYLKEAILNRELTPHDRIRAQAVAAALDISRTPVREALGRLEQEGFVLRDGGWGYVVRAMTFKEVMDFYKVRDALEATVIAEVMDKLTPVLIKRLEAELQKAEQNVARNRIKGYSLHARRFYTLLAEATENMCLREMMSVIDDRIRWLGVILNNQSLDRPRESLAENKTVLAALKAGDAAAAVAAVKWHVSCAREAFRQCTFETGAGITLPHASVRKN